MLGTIPRCGQLPAR